MSAPYTPLQGQGEPVPRGTHLEAVCVCLCWL